jgi:hypothetical protein
MLSRVIVGWIRDDTTLEDDRGLLAVANMLEHCARELEVFAAPAAPTSTHICHPPHVYPHLPPPTSTHISRRPRLPTSAD